MSQFISDFVSIVTPPMAAPSLAEPIPLHPDKVDTLTFDQARQRHDAWFAALSERITDLTVGGHLIEVPLCPSVCQPGDLADFILDIDLDPFGRWNMMLFADRHPTADLLNTLCYDRPHQTSVDDPLMTALDEMRCGGDLRHPVALQNQVLTAARRVEDLIFSARRTISLRHASEIQGLVPPKATFNPSISAGKGAAN